MLWKGCIVPDRQQSGIGWGGSFQTGEGVGGIVPGSCQSLGSFDVQVLTLLSSVCVCYFSRLPHVWVTGSQINSPFLRQVIQMLHQIRYVLYILPAWESRGGQNELEGLIPTTVCRAQCRHCRGQFTGLSDPHRVRLNDNNFPFWL